MIDDQHKIESEDAELRCRWARKGAPAVSVVPDEAITGRTRDRVDLAVDVWLRQEAAAARGDDVHQAVDATEDRWQGNAQE